MNTKHLSSSFCSSAYAAVVGKNWWICIFCNSSSQSSKWFANKARKCSFYNHQVVVGRRTIFFFLFQFCLLYLFCRQLGDLQCVTLVFLTKTKTEIWEISLESCRVPTTSSVSFLASIMLSFMLMMFHYFKLELAWKSPFYHYFLCRITTRWKIVRKCVLKLTKKQQQTGGKYVFGFSVFWRRGGGNFFCIFVHRQALLDHLLFF